jgi:hypothetical protein
LLPNRPIEVEMPYVPLQISPPPSHLRLRNVSSSTPPASAHITISPQPSASANVNLSQPTPVNVSFSTPPASAHITISPQPSASANVNLSQPTPVNVSFSTPPAAAHITISPPPAAAHITISPPPAAAHITISPPSAAANVNLPQPPPEVEEFYETAPEIDLIDLSESPALSYHQNYHSISPASLPTACSANFSSPSSLALAAASYVMEKYAMEGFCFKCNSKVKINKILINCIECHSEFVELD